MGHILKMEPVFKEMIWGGHKLHDVYGYEIPSNHTGECWAISAHKIVQLRMGNLKGKHYQIFLKIIENCSETLKGINFHCL